MEMALIAVVVLAFLASNLPTFMTKNRSTGSLFTTKSKTARNRTRNRAKRNGRVW